MIPVLMAIVFIIAVFAIFWYIFRGIRDDESNPIWGNLFASFLNVVLCVILAYSFLNGNIMDLNVVENASYTVSYPMLDSSIAPVINSHTAAERQYVLGRSGSGMYTITAIDSMSDVDPYISNFTVSYLTKDIVYLQVQDWTLFFLYSFLACVSGLLFCWFLYPIVAEFFGWGEQESDMTDVEQE